MSAFGAEYILFGKFKTEETDTAAPTYEEPERLGPLMVANMTITPVEGKHFGDNIAQVHISKFGYATIGTELTDANKKAIGTVLGAEVTEDGKHIKYKAGDKAAVGGLAYIKNIIRSNNQELFEVKFYTKVTGARTADNIETQTDSITFTSYPLTFTALPPMHKDTHWLEEKEFETREEAKQWINERFTGVSAGG